MTNEIVRLRLGGALILMLGVGLRSLGPVPWGDALGAVAVFAGVLMMLVRPQKVRRNRLWLVWVGGIVIGTLGYLVAGRGVSLVESGLVVALLIGSMVVLLVRRGRGGSDLHQPPRQ